MVNREQVEEAGLGAPHSAGKSFGQYLREVPGEMRRFAKQVGGVVENCVHGAKAAAKVIAIPAAGALGAFGGAEAVGHAEPVPFPSDGPGNVNGIRVEGAMVMHGAQDGRLNPDVDPGSFTMTFFASDGVDPYGGTDIYEEEFRVLDDGSVNAVELQGVGRVTKVPGLDDPNVNEGLLALMRGPNGQLLTRVTDLTVEGHGDFVGDNCPPINDLQIGHGPGELKV